MTPSCGTGAKRLKDLFDQTKPMEDLREEVL